MWIFMNDAMFSIVEHHKYSNTFVIRARVKGDLEKVFPNQRVFENDDTDYRFRIFINRDRATEIIKDRILDINYTNFKGSINPEDKDRKLYYTRVWSAMLDWQEHVYGVAQWWLNYRYFDFPKTKKEKKNKFVGYSKK